MILQENCTYGNRKDYRAFADFFSAIKRLMKDPKNGWSAKIILEDQATQGGASIY